jgi:hypothetical protein
MMIAEVANVDRLPLPNGAKPGLTLLPNNR